MEPLHSLTLSSPCKLLQAQNAKISVEAPKAHEGVHGWQQPLPSKTSISVIEYPAKTSGLTPEAIANKCWHPANLNAPYLAAKNAESGEGTLITLGVGNGEHKLLTLGPLVEP